MTRSAPVRGERGFALLIVFLMAAAVALMLYRQIPRVAFESQRDKEQALIDRGEGYKRAIQLYFIAFKKYPSKIEDLENTNNKRFLRRRFIDPMTGKDEWRLVHVNGAGLLTDSLVQKPPTPGDDKDKDKTQVAGNTTGGATLGTRPGGTATDAPPEVNAAVLRRPSDRPMTPFPGVGQTAGIVGADPNNPNPYPPITNQYPPITNQYPPITLQPGAGQPGSVQPGSVQPGASPQGFTPQFPGQQFPGQQYPGQQPAQPYVGQTTNIGQPYPGQPNIGQAVAGQQLPGQQFPGQQFPGQQFPGQPPTGGLPPGFQPGVPGQIVPGQSGVTPTVQGQLGFNPQNPNGVNIPLPNQPNQVINSQMGGIQVTPFQPQGGQAPLGGGPGVAPNAAIGLINDMLRTPRQAPGGSGSAFNNTPMAGGIAGVASTYTGPSIKVYKDRSKYQEWEFIFDLKQALPGQTQTGTQGPQRPGQNVPAGANPANFTPTGLGKP